MKREKLSKQELRELNMELAVMQESIRKTTHEIVYDKNEFDLAKTPENVNKFDIILGLFANTRVNINALWALAAENAHIYIPFSYSALIGLHKMQEQSLEEHIATDVLVLPKLSEVQTYPNEVARTLTDNFKVLLIYKGNKLFEKPTKSTYWFDYNSSSYDAVKIILSNYNLPKQNILDISDVSGATINTSSIKYWNSVSIPYTKQGEENCEKELRKTKLNAG